jgi:hypothetical protein
MHQKHPPAKVAVSATAAGTESTGARDGPSSPEEGPWKNIPPARIVASRAAPRSQYDWVEGVIVS